MIFKLPQIIYVIIIAMGLSIHLVKDGETRYDKYNFLTTLIGAVIELAILWWGGFFG